MHALRARAIDAETLKPIQGANIGIDGANWGLPKRQLPMWHHYRVELYPHYGQGSGIRDPLGYELKFPSAFRLSRRGGRP